MHTLDGLLVENLEIMTKQYITLESANACLARQVLQLVTCDIDTFLLYGTVGPACRGGRAHNLPARVLSRSNQGIIPCSNEPTRSRGCGQRFGFHLGPEGRASVDYIEELTC